jgi:hypothetical protein
VIHAGNEHADARATEPRRAMRAPDDEVRPSVDDLRATPARVDERREDADDDADHQLQRAERAAHRGDHRVSHRRSSRAHTNALTDSTPIPPKLLVSHSGRHAGR